MRVILTSYYYKPHIGGVENSLYYLAKESMDAGHSVRIIASDADLSKKKRLVNYEIAEGIEIYRFKRFIPWISVLSLFSPLIDVGVGFLYFRKLTKTFKPDIVITRHYITGLSAKLAGLKVYYLVPGIVKFQEELSLKAVLPTLLKQRIINFYIRTFMLPVTQWIQTWLLKRADRIFVFSNTMKQQVQFLLKKDRDITIAKPGVDTKRFLKYTRTEARAMLGLKSNAIIFLVLGRLTAHKNIHFVLETFSALNLPDYCQLMIVGDGPEKEGLVRKRNNLQMQERVLMFPATLEPEKFFIASDAFIMASVHETFGQTVIEAMAAGNILIGLKFDSLKFKTATQEILNESEDFLIPPEELGKCITTIAQTASGAHHRKPENIHRARKMYSWQSLLQDLLIT